MEWKYKKIKRVNFKKWLLGGNAKLYFVILIFFLVAVVFALISLRTIESETPPEDETDSLQYETTTQVLTKTESTIPNNLGYKIVINKQINILFVYKKENNQEYSFFKAMYCAINPNVDVSLTKISSKQSWYALDKYSFGHYATILDDGAVIHSAPYWTRDKNNLDYESYNKIGSEEARRGSIYVKAADAKWIYENCGINIDVEIVDRSEDVNSIPGFTIEEITKLPKGSYYDPSDR